MENSPQSQIKTKKDVNFWNMLIVYVYHAVGAAIVVFIPFMLVFGIGMMVKYPGQLENIELLKQRLMSNSLISGLAILLNLIVFVLITTSIVYDLGKNYQVDKNNYKKALNFLLIIFAIRLVLTFSISSLILTIVAGALLYWLVGKKFGKGDKILEKKILSLKNSALMAIAVVILSIAVIYFI